MSSTSGYYGFFPSGCTASCTDNDRYEGRLRLGQFDVSTEQLDWYHEQKKWFGQSNALAYGDWGTNDIFLAGAVDDNKWRQSDSSMEWAPCVFHMQNNGLKN